jgi:predicted signal transduction protein with EAL and GGDEF domain
MAKGMGIETTAEGVETQQQLQVVRDEGYTQMQGYLVSHPLPADEVEEMLRSKGLAKPADVIEQAPEEIRAKLAISGRNRPQ